jgi:6,7-dimethyl-8-ribityllumazine synthase
VNTFVGEREGSGRRFAVVAARFNEIVTSKLVEGATAGLVKHGVAEDHIDVAWVPGAFEIPLVADRLASSGRYDAVICLGAVIRGETAHFELVANEAARGIATVSLRTGVLRGARDRRPRPGRGSGRWRAREQRLGRGRGGPRDGRAPGAPAGGRGRALTGGSDVLG